MTKKTITVFLLLFVFLIAVGFSPVSAVTITEGDYAEFQIQAPGTDTIKFYVLGQNKFYSGEDVSKEKLKGTALKEYLKTHGYYIYHGDDGLFTIYLMADEDISKENHFSYGEYQVIVHHPGTDGIYNTQVLPASEEAGYATGYNVMLNGVFQFNIPSVQNLEAAEKLAETISKGNDPCARHIFSVTPQKEKEQFIIVTKEEKEITPPVPEPEQQQPATSTPFPIISIIAATGIATLIVNRR